MATLSRLLSDVRNNLGNVSSEVVNDGQLLPLIEQTVDLYNAGLELSDQNQLATKTAPIYPTGKDIITSALAGGGMEAFVERQTDSTEDVWVPVPIINANAIGQAEINGERKCAFYGSPRRIKFSWDVTEDDYPIRIWYDPQNSTFSSLTESPKYPSYYHTMVSVRASLRALPLVLKVKPDLASFCQAQGITLERELNGWEDQWRHWRFDSRQPGVTTKRRMFSRRAYR